MLNNLSIPFNRTICPLCNGTGKEADYRNNDGGTDAMTKKCHNCNGKGYVGLSLGERNE
jgi:DnaJ-class molecular chaperone